jgi:hypothetical protein
MANYDTNTAVVRQVQTAVNAAGYQPLLTVDGAYGPKTIAGVKWFQKLHGLTQDGIIGDQTVAATIAPTPSGAPSGPLAALQTQLQQLQSTGTAAMSPTPTAPSTPLISHAVVSLRPPIGMLSFASPDASTASSTLDNVRPPALGAMTTAPTALAGGIAGGLGLSMPMLLAGGGLVVGAALGSLVMFPLGALLGGLAGAAAGYGYSTLTPAGATMHGETDSEFCDVGFDSDYGEPTLIGCEIGLPANVSTLKG